ncbi:hypothetical protein H0H93_008200 [Arthromyces matolae]|nr:hypothetical protein H0H93_008200 [Arthromyces matolae]
MSTSDDGEITLSDVYHVLKDVWLCSDSKGEKAIQDDIFKRLAEVDKEKGTSHEFEARPYFVNILNDWKVKLEGTSDETPGIPSGWRPASVTRLRATFNPVASGSSRAVTSSGDIEKPSTPETTALKSRHIPRQHYWTVYGQLCQSIYEVPDYETMIRVIIGIFKALHYLFIAGYVHRDVSAGNCLWYPEGKVGKLSDLEYARPYEELSGHNSRPGTSAFMAVEYATGCPLYFQAPDSSDDDDYGYRPNDSLPFEVQSEDAQFTEVHESGDAEDVHFNFYHGIESAIWIYYWFMIHNLPKALLHEKEKFEALPAKTGLFNGDVRLRRSMLSSVTRRGAVNNHLLAAYTSPFDVLIIDISVFESLSGAYQSLAKRNPLKGGFVPKSIFRSKLYVKMRREFDVLLNQIEEKRREKVDFGSVNLSAGIADKTGKTRE